MIYSLFYSVMVVNILIDKLHEATKKRDRIMLEQAIKEANKSALDAPDDIGKAEETLKVINARDGKSSH